MFLDVVVESLWNSKGGNFVLVALDFDELALKQNIQKIAETGMRNKGDDDLFCTFKCKYRGQKSGVAQKELCLLILFIPIFFE